MPETETPVRRRRTYPAKGKALIGLRLAKELNPEQLCRKARIDPKTLARLESGEEAYLSTLTKVADALGVSVAEIADGLPRADSAPELIPPHLCVITLTLKIPIDKFDELRGPLDLLTELKKRFGLSGEFAVNGVKEGSTQVEFVGTEEDWFRLSAGFNRGKMQDIDVATIHCGRLPEPAKAFWGRDNLCRALAVLSILCALSGVLPVPARYVYLGGQVIAVLAIIVGSRFRRWRWSLMWLPVLALILNFAANAFWPWCLGFEKTPQGYRFGLVNRDPAWMQPPTER